MSRAAAVCIALLGAAVVTADSSVALAAQRAGAVQHARTIHCRTLQKSTTMTIRTVGRRAPVALSLDAGCTGRMRIHVTGSAPTVVLVSGARNLVVVGAVSCSARADTRHQTAIAVRSAVHVTFQRLAVACQAPRGLAFSIRSFGTAGRVRRTVCSACDLKGPMLIGASIASGISSSSVVVPPGHLCLMAAKGIESPVVSRSTCKRGGVSSALAFPAPRGTVVPAPLVPPTLTGNQLSTRGTQIVDASGAPFLIHAVQVRGMGSGSGSDTPDACGLSWSPPDARQPGLVVAAGFNTVYYSISWNNLEPTAPAVDASGALVHAWNTAWLAALHASVSQFTGAGLRVILVMNHYQWSSAFRNFFMPASGGHICEGFGMPAWLYPNTPDGTDPSLARCEFFADTRRPGSPVAPQEGMQAALAEIAAEFASDDRVVGIDPISEPGTGGQAKSCGASPTSAVTFYDAAARAIHAVDGKLLIFAEDGTYEHLSKAGTMISGPFGEPNMVYAFEYYPTHADEIAFLPSAKAIGDQLGVPSFIYALDAFHGGYPEAQWTDPTWQADTRAALAFAKANSIGWSFWALWPGAGSALYVNTYHPVAKPDLLAVLASGF